MLLSISLTKSNPWSSSSWWEEINKSQGGIFFTLCGFYALVSAIALIQLIRIEIRLSGYGWTIQKVFHLMNFIGYGVRAIVFSLVSGYTAGLMTATWFILWENCSLQHFGSCCMEEGESCTAYRLILTCFSVFVLSTSWIVFILNAFRLFFMLRRYPVESEGKKRKLHEDVLSAFDSEVSLDVLGHPVLNLLFYMLAEILSSALVLFILRKLPPREFRRSISQFVRHQIFCIIHEHGNISYLVLRLHNQKLKLVVYFVGKNSVNV